MGTAGRFRLRRFVSRRIPSLERVLLIESGSRELFEGLIPGIFAHHGDGIMLDVVTCFSCAPNAFRPAQGTVYNVNDYSGPDGRARLLEELRAKQYTAIGIICSGEPIMTKWKWWLAAKLPAKFFVLNENGDYFWVDRSNWRTVKHFVLYRAGLSGAGAAKTIGELLLFPFGVLYLISYAAYVHLRRRINLTRKAVP